jgi:hypothetical protein
MFFVGWTVKKMGKTSTIYLGGIVNVETFFETRKFYFFKIESNRFLLKILTPFWFK